MVERQSVCGELHETLSRATISRTCIVVARPWPDFLEKKMNKLFHRYPSHRRVPMVVLEHADQEASRHFCSGQFQLETTRQQLMPFSLSLSRFFLPHFLG